MAFKSKTVSHTDEAHVHSRKKWSKDYSNGVAKLWLDHSIVINNLNTYFVLVSYSQKLLLLFQVHNRLLVLVKLKIWHLQQHHL